MSSEKGSWGGEGEWGAVLQLCNALLGKTSSLSIYNFSHRLFHPAVCFNLNNISGYLYLIPKEITTSPIPLTQ